MPINNSCTEGGAVRRRGRPKKEGAGFAALLGPFIKLAAPAVIDLVAGAAKKKMGIGVSRKMKDGGALMPAGTKGFGAKRVGRPSKKTNWWGTISSLKTPGSL